MLDLTDRNGKKDIKSMTLEEVTAELGTLGEKPFRAKQLYDWLHVKLVTDFDQMSTLSKSLRERLKEHYSVTALKVVGERISAVDGTRKYLFGLEDGNVIESVWMKYHHGNSVCISSQVEMCIRDSCDGFRSVLPVYLLCGMRICKAAPSDFCPTP